jgi:hypothetical protein
VANVIIARLAMRGSIPHGQPTGKGSYSAVPAGTILARAIFVFSEY